MKNDKIIQIISMSKPELQKRYQVKTIAVFGSFARGDNHSSSDIDLLVEFENNADLFDLIGLGDFLEEKLSVKVDVVSKNGLRKEIKENILREALTL
jgi:hypothetical protein